MQGFYTTALLAAVHGQLLEDVHAVQHDHEHALVHSKAARPMNMGRQKDGGVLCAKQVPFGLAVRLLRGPKRQRVPMQPTSYEHLSVPGCLLDIAAISAIHIIKRARAFLLRALLASKVYAGAPVARPSFSVREPSLDCLGSFSAGGGGASLLGASDSGFVPLSCVCCATSDASTTA